MKAILQWWFTMQKETCIVYVSHRLEEVMELGDRTTILRDGHFISTRDIKDITIDDLVTGMVGRKIEKSAWKKSYATDEVLMSVKTLGRNRRFRANSFQLRKVEIL